MHYSNNKTKIIKKRKKERNNNNKRCIMSVSSVGVEELKVDRWQAGCLTGWWSLSDYHFPLLLLVTNNLGVVWHVVRTLFCLSFVIMICIPYKVFLASPKPPQYNNTSNATAAACMHATSIILY